MFFPHLSAPLTHPPFHPNPTICCTIDGSRIGLLLSWDFYLQVHFSKGKVQLRPPPPFSLPPSLSTHTHTLPALVPLPCFLQIQYFLQIQHVADKFPVLQALGLSIFAFYCSWVILVFLGSVLLDSVDSVFMCYLLDKDSGAVTHQEVTTAPSKVWPLCLGFNRYLLARCRESYSEQSLHSTRTVLYSNY